MKVLVIDDHSEIRDIIKFYLRNTGIEVRECSCGNQAITILKTGEIFDLVISDYQMPNGNGLDVMRHLSQSEAMTAFILFTSFWGLEVPIPYAPFLGLISKNDPQKFLNAVVSLKEKLP